MDVTCPNCGATNRQTSRFCAKCGQALPQPAAPAKPDSGDLNLPWLKGVQERAAVKAGDLDSALQPDYDPTGDAPSAAKEPPSEAPPAGGQPRAESVEGETLASDVSTEAPAQTEPAGEDKSPADEPPPEWVVGILEPGTSKAPEEGSYEPEELNHIMPWLNQAGAVASPEGEQESTPGPATPGLPPWLSGVTVQETLQTGGSQAEGKVPDTAELELEGLEPFVPPEPEQVVSEPKPSKSPPAEQAPAWLKSIRGAAAQPVQEEAPAHPLEPQPLLKTGGLEPTGGLVEPVVRDIPVRPPRAGSVETLAALLQSPVGEVARRVPGMEHAVPEVTVRRGDLRHWFFPDGLIYLLVLTALLAVLIIRPPFGEQNAPSAPDVLQFYNAIESAPTGKPVLVVYDWDASRSAEMQALSEAVTHHLMSRRLHFVTLSTIPQGPGFAQQVTDMVASDPKANYGYRYDRDYLVLGYLPGNEAALGSLVRDFKAALPLDYVRSRSIQNSELIRAENLQSLSDFSLVIDLASDEAALRNWVEQVATRVRVPIIAAVPQGLEPLARPYRLASGAGLRALVSGQAGALQYAQQLGRHGQGISADTGFFADGTLAGRLNAQSVAQLLVGLVIVAAFVRLGTQRIFRR